MERRERKESQSLCHMLTRLSVGVGLCLVTVAHDEGCTAFFLPIAYTVFERVASDRGWLSLVFSDDIFKIKLLCLKTWFPLPTLLTCKTASHFPSTHTLPCVAAMLTVMHVMRPLIFKLMAGSG